MSFYDNEPQRLPSQQDYFQSTVRINKLISRDDMGTAWYFDNELRKVHSQSPPFRRTMLNASRMAKRSTESYVDTRIAKSIALGALAGTFVSFDVHAFDVLRMKDIIASSGVDVLDTSHVLGDQIAEIGDEGLRLIGPKAAEAVGSWSRRIDHDPESQEIFRRSFGVVAIGAHNIQLNYTRVQGVLDPSFVEFKQRYELFNSDSPDFDAEIAAFLDGSS